jgi:hypothetical protein
LHDELPLLLYFLLDYNAALPANKKHICASAQICAS